MLAFTNKGFEGLDFNVLGAKSGSDGVPERVNFLRWEFHGAVETIKEPAQYFFARIPDAFSVDHQLL